MKCCICGREIKGFGNNPCGALDENGKPIEFGEDDRCCDCCNNTHVIPGRLFTLVNKKKGQ